MIEAVISLAAVIITVAAISTVVALSVSNTGFIGDQNKASKYAQEAMEYLRSLADDNFNSFKSKYVPSGIQNSYCLGPNINNPAGFSPSSIPPCNNAADKLEGTKFKRDVIVINQTSSATAVCAGGLKVIVSVRWQSGKCKASAGESYCHNSTLTSCFTDEASLP